MTIATLAAATARGRAPSRRPVSARRRASHRLAPRASPASDRSGRAGSAAAPAQQFAAFWRRSCLRAREIGARCAQRLSATARPAIAFVRAQLGKAQLRFCVRAIVNALLAFGVTHMLAIPLHGQWAVPTAVAVIQMSIGGSLKAAAEYIIGTIGGALYATMVAALVPTSTELLLRIRARARGRAARLCGGDQAQPARRAGDRRAGPDDLDQARRSADRSRL